MTDLIRRADAIAFINSGISLDTDADREYATEMLKNIPSAEAEQVTGKLNNPCDSLLTEDSDERKEQKSKLDLISRADAIETVRMSEHRITIADEQGGVGTVKWDMWGVYTAEAVEAIKALPSADMKSWNGLYIKVYDDDDPQDKAEKLYQICDSDETLAEVAKCIQGYLDEPSAEAVQIPIKLEKRYPESKDEDITDAFMRGYKSAQAVQGWIPCSERLPKVGENVLFTTDIYGGYVAEGDRRADGKWWQYRWNALLQDDEVTAWMPLPKPYTKGDNDEER